MWKFVLPFLIILGGSVWAQNRKKNPEKIFNIYSQPGRWYYLKYFLFLIILKFRQISSNYFKNKTQSNGGGLGQNVNTSDEKLETLQQLSSHEKAFDAVFFQAVTQDGYYFAAGTERRHGGKINGLLYLATPDYGLLMNEQLPQTMLDADPVSIYTMKEYSAEGICFTPLKPMRAWKVAYTGKMRLQKEPEKLIDVTFEGEWTTSLKHFLFDTEMDIRSIARATAREEWSREYFESLKKAHQTHYEQMGKLKLTLTINNEIRTLTMSAFRDHSFGNKRDWTLMHRYIFHMIYLKDDTRACVGVVCQPSTASHLEMGYVVLPNKTTHTIRSCDLLLYQHGENGNPPKHIAFSFSTDSHTYEVVVDVEYEAIHYVGNNTEAKMFERFVKYQVNGVEGRGISEWHYNHSEYK